jgi:tRNA (guanine37-N1)-methyltransferase
LKKIKFIFVNPASSEKRSKKRKIDMRRIWILTLFPEYFLPLTECGVVGRAFASEGKIGPVELKVVSIRHFCSTSYKGVDDAPYGGGPGMVMRADVLQKALWDGVIQAGGYGEDLATVREKLCVVFPSPRGQVWRAQLAFDWQKEFFSGLPEGRDLAFICGRYEGIDERFLAKYVEREVSLGDFILSGGEIATMAVLDSLLRLVPGVLGNGSSLDEESFGKGEGTLEAPLYTRPRLFEGMGVPEVLLSGHAAKIGNYHREEGLRVTKERRPDLVEIVDEVGSKKDGN